LLSATRSLASHNFERVAQLEVDQVNQTEWDERKSVGNGDMLESLSSGSLSVLSHPTSTIPVLRPMFPKASLLKEFSPATFQVAQRISANTQGAPFRFRSVPAFSFGGAASMERLTKP